MLKYEVIPPDLFGDMMINIRKNDIRRMCDDYVNNKSTKKQLINGLSQVGLTNFLIVDVFKQCEKQRKKHKETKRKLRRS